MKKILDVIGPIGLAIATVVFLLVVGPLLLIWGLNLLGFDVPLTFKTLLGAFLIMITLRNSTGEN